MIYFVSVAGIAALSCIIYCVIRTKNMRLVSGATLLFIGFFTASVGVGSATYPIAHSVAKENAVSGYHQQLNGNIVDVPPPEHFKCSKDGPCKWTYACDYYFTTEYYTDSNGQQQSREDLHWHNCPYVTEEWSYTATDSFGNTYVYGDHIFSKNPKPWDRDRAVKSGVPRGVPAQWQHASDALKRGDSDPVIVESTYKNFILSSEDSILKAASNNIDQLRKAKLLPDHTRNVTNPIHDKYLADKMSFVGFTPADAAKWQDELLHFDAHLGMTSRGDLHIVAIKASAIPSNVSSQDYLNALKAYWLNNLGKYAFAKNGIALVLAVNDSATQVEWAKATTGMPIGNGIMLQRLSSQLGGLPFTPEAILGHTSASVDPTTHKTSYTLGNGRAAQIIMREFPFVRACMECKDKDEKGQHSFVDLGDMIPLSKAGYIWGTIILLIIVVWGCLGIYSFLFVEGWYDDPEDSYRKYQNYYGADPIDVEDLYPEDPLSSTYNSYGVAVAAKSRRKTNSRKKDRNEY